MSDIKRGDLVAVIRPCPYCGDDEAVGKVFCVTDIFYSGQPMDCCGQTQKHRERCAADGSPDGSGHPVRFLKRIPPLEKLEDEKHDEEIHA